LSQLADQIADQGNQSRIEINHADEEVQFGEPAHIENPYQDIFGDINKFTKAQSQVSGSSLKSDPDYLVSKLASEKKERVKIQAILDYMHTYKQNLIGAKTPV